jgi:hypothetical protein
MSFPRKGWQFTCTTKLPHLPRQRQTNFALQHRGRAGMFTFETNI